MQAVIIALVVGLIVYLLMYAFVPGMRGKEKSQYTKKLLQKIENETVSFSDVAAEDVNVLREYRISKSESMDQLLRKIPTVESTHKMLVKSGLGMTLGTFYMIVLVIALILLLLTQTMHFGALGVVLSVVGGYLIALKIVKMRIKKRTENFINNFPDAVDMILRSVKSGHPVNAALRMIAENMSPPISTEFKQVVQEVSYGRTLSDALFRLAQRIDESDIRFFVVVLSVQQETGGNLAEVLANLSNIIRKRKQLRLKIKAMTAEGRMTAWILGCLPFVLFGVIYLLSPDYLDPLFETTTGNFILGAAAVMVALAGFIVNKMIDIEI